MALFQLANQLDSAAAAVGVRSGACKACCMAGCVVACRVAGGGGAVVPARQPA